MPTATPTAPRTTSKLDALQVLRFPAAVGWTRCNAALESLGRKAGIEAFAHRLRYYGADWMAVDRDWRSREAVRAVADLERNLGRELDDDERGTFVVAMIDLMHDLV
jgi:hypothetical protein